MEQNASTWASPVEVRKPRTYANMPMNALKTDMNAIKLSILDQTCRDMGKQQGDLRIYSSEECAAMNGIYHVNGECTKKYGGSFSAECGMLYNGKNAVAREYAKEGVVANAKEGVVANAKEGVVANAMGESPLPYGTMATNTDYLAPVDSVPGLSGGRRKRTRRGKGRRRGTRRYRK